MRQFESLANHIAHLVYQFEYLHKIRVKDIEVEHFTCTDNETGKEYVKPEVRVTIEQRGCLNVNLDQSD